MAATPTPKTKAAGALAPASVIDGTTKTLPPKTPENAGESSPESVPEMVAGLKNRRATWKALAWLWESSSLPSVRYCRRSVLGNEATAGVKCSATGRARYCRLKTCGSVWACPICSTRVWGARSRQIERVFLAAAERGNGATMTTLTMRHHKRQTLGYLWDALSGSWNRLNNDRKVKKLRAENGWLGSIRRTEVTWGFSNGWHVHNHIVDFWGEDTTAVVRAAYEGAAYASWSSGLKAKKMAAPTKEHGVDVVRLSLDKKSAYELSEYVTSRTRTSHSVAFELTDALCNKDAKKGNRTPWQILASAMAGNSADVKLWKQWEEGSKGRRALLISNALKAAFPELDEEIEQDDAQEQEAELFELVEEAYALLLEKVNPGELLANVERGFAGVEGDPDLWDRWKAAQMYAAKMLAELGITEGVHYRDLDDERAIRDALADALPAWWYGVDLSGEALPVAKPGEDAQAALFVVGNDSAISL